MAKKARLLISAIGALTLYACKNDTKQELAPVNTDSIEFRISACKTHNDPSGIKSETCANYAGNGREFNIRRVSYHSYLEKDGEKHYLEDLTLQSGIIGEFVTGDKHAIKFPGSIGNLVTIWKGKNGTFLWDYDFDNKVDQRYDTLTGEVVKRDTAKAELLFMESDKLFSEQKERLLQQSEKILQIGTFSIGQ